MIVYKMGGAALKHCIDDSELFLKIAQTLSRPFVMVHGGGPEITKLAEQLGIKSEFIQGQRVTSSQMLEIVLMSLRGKTNSQLVAQLCSAGINAIGCSGLDAKLFECTPENPELGFVGKILKTNIDWIKFCLSNGYRPIISSVGYLLPTKDTKFSICNINADLAASAVAISLKASEFVFTTDTEGILTPEGECIPRLSVSQIDKMISMGEISGGMIVKIRGALEYLKECPDGTLRIAGGKTPDQILNVFNNPDYGTVITN